jgi:RHS repeat-associated protein
VEGATEYVIYRYVFRGGLFFYPTQVQAATADPVQVYIEDGDGGYHTPVDADDDCPTTSSSSWNHGPPPLDAYNCATGWLEAYYVTARQPDPVTGEGGEGPRSEIVFWDCCEQPGYARLFGPPSETDETTAIASVMTPPMAPLEDGLALPGLAGVDESLGVCDIVEEREVHREPLSDQPEWTPATAPLLTLAGEGDPPFHIYDMHVDHLGSTRLVTDDAGDIVSEHKFLPFGEEILPMREYSTKMFTGHERDDESGLDYMLGRYYSAFTARFLSTDPGGYDPITPAIWNRYVYAANNPLFYVDLDGEEIIPSWGDPRMDEVIALVMDFVTYSPDFAAEYNAHVGPDNPDLLIGTDPTLEEAGTADLIWGPNGGYAGTDITINATLDFGELLRAIAEEFGHAHDFRTNTAGVKQEVLQRSRAYEDRAKMWGADVRKQRAEARNAEKKRLKEKKRKEREGKRTNTKERGTITDFDRPRHLGEWWERVGL